MDATGKVLDTKVIFPTAPQNKVEESKAELKKLIKKYNVDLTKTLMFNNKKKKSVRHIVVENECNYCDIVDEFIPKDYNVVYIVSDDGKVKDIITETQVIDKLTTEQVL